jgi:hypothetical protein
MAEKKTESVSTVEQTVYVTEESPKLPTADVAASRDLPVIDKRLIEVRNAEAKAMADRFK